MRCVRTSRWPASHLAPLSFRTFPQNLADAIANCCSWRDNRAVFGDEEAVAPLYKFLLSKQMAVHRATARALHQLSKDPMNCITMHRAGVVRPLIGTRAAVLHGPLPTVVLASGRGMCPKTIISGSPFTPLWLVCLLILRRDGRLPRLCAPGGRRFLPAQHPRPGTR